VANIGPFLSINKTEFLWCDAAPDPLSGTRILANDDRLLQWKCTAPGPMPLAAVKRLAVDEKEIDGPRAGAATDGLMALATHLRMAQA